MWRIAQRRSFLRIARSIAHLADDRIGNVGLHLTRFRIGPLKAFFIHHLQNHSFNLAGDAIGFFNVRSNGFGDENVQVLRFIAWEELHLGWEGSEQNKRQDHQARRSKEERPRASTGQGVAKEAIVPLLQTRQEPVLKHACSGIQHIRVCDGQ